MRVRIPMMPISHSSDSDQSFRSIPISVVWRKAPAVGCISFSVFGRCVKHG